MRVTTEQRAQIRASKLAMAFEDLIVDAETAEARVKELEADKLITDYYIDLRRNGKPLPTPPTDEVHELKLILGNISEILDGCGDQCRVCHREIQDIIAGVVGHSDNVSLIKRE